MAKVCVTGAAGFIGGHVAEELLRRGHQVVGLDDFSSGKRETAALLSRDPQFRMVEGSIADPVAVEKAVSGAKHVFHLAAIPSVPVSMKEPERTTAVNVGGTVNVLEAARRAGTERVVLACSCAAYGDGPEQPKHETLPVRPVSPYAAQKIACELYAQTYTTAYGLPCVALRFFN
ncbi:MAG TPA: SDR family NAD(P)-dependent oxidoreductase, partial [Myxococcales bacterium]|nr:SDR family NAD(P)-dependent oxidoreductase [Myxococcales bacterium]